MLNRHVTFVFSLLASFSGSACSAFFVPDSVIQGCNTSSDCSAIADNRFIAQCVYGDGQPEGSEKVCVADFREVGCNAADYGGGHPFFEIYSNATSTQNRPAYRSCDPENDGMRGCEPGVAGCAAGLTENIMGVCDEPDAEFPAVSPGDFELDEVAGQDVKDQFCRFYFCDESFVCDTSGSRQLCRRCDPNESFGKGGCGTLYIQGAPSTVYASLDNANCNGNKDVEDVIFGEINEP